MGQAPDFEQTQTGFLEKLEQLTAGRREKLLALRDHYVQALTTLEQRHGQGNREEAAEEVRLERVKTEGGQLDAELEGRLDPDLRHLVGTLRRGILQVEHEHSAEVRALVLHYQQGARTVAGRLSGDAARQWSEWGAGLENHLRGLRPPPSANAQAAAAPEVSPLEGLILYYTFQDVEGGRIEDRGPVGNHARLDGARTDGHGHTVNSGAVHFHQGDGRMGRIQRVPEARQAVILNTPVKGLPLEEFTLVVRFRVDRNDRIRGAMLGSEGLPSTTERTHWRNGWRLTPSGLHWYGDGRVPGEFHSIPWEFRASSRWNHLCLIRSDGEIQVVLNGRAVTKVKDPGFGPLSLRHNHFYIGDPYFEMYPPRYESFFGSVSSVALFSRALEITEIQRMMSDPNAP